MSSHLLLNGVDGSSLHLVAKSNVPKPVNLLKKPEKYALVTIIALIFTPQHWATSPNSTQEKELLPLLAFAFVSNSSSPSKSATPQQLGI